MYPLETNRDARELKWQHKVNRKPEKRLPAIVDWLYGRRKQKGELE